MMNALLAARIVEQRAVKYGWAMMMAAKHPAGSIHRARYEDEAAHWMKACEAANRGDLTATPYIPPVIFSALVVIL